MTSDPSYPAGAIEVSILGGADWRAYKELRMEMLRNAPTAFWATLESVSEREDDQWREEVQGPRVHVHARMSGHVVGAASIDAHGYSPELALDEHTINLVSVYVRPAARGRGVLEALMRGVCAWMRAHGRHRILLETVNDNYAARRAYEKLGFRETGRTSPDPRRENFVEVEYEADIENLILGEHAR